MKCNITNRSDLIARYLSGELPENEAAKFEEHYFQCEICFNEFKLAEDSLRMIEETGREAFSSNKSLTSQRDNSFFNNLLGLSGTSGWRLALSVSVVAILVLLIVFIFIPRDTTQIINDQQPKISDKTEEPVQQEPDETPNQIEPKPSEDFAVLSGPAFETVPYFEEWIKDNIRTGINNQISIISPVSDEMFFDKDLIFNWKMSSDEELSLVILDNRENELLIKPIDKVQMPDFKIRVGPEIFTRSGLYYWRIEDENEILYIGKFYFIK